MVEVVDQGALIIGGGIGGLCTALALRQAGIKATVFEQSREMKEIGAGISLWANALKALDKLGVADQVKEVCVPGTSGEIHSWQGELLTEISSVELKSKFGAAHIAIHRADLQAVLLKAFGSDDLRCGAKFLHFNQDESGVTACFADGREVRGTFLVGADGLNSVVRSQLFGNSKPDYAGYTAWRGVTAFSDPAFPVGLGLEIWGRGQRFGVTHISRGRVYWFATKNVREGGPDKPGGRKPELLELFQGYPAPVEAIIQATDDAEILRNDIYERKPLKHWSEGRVTLLGDAAHPMTPNLGQGACQAIEDAVALAECFRVEQEVETALQRYEQRRLPRTIRVVNQSRRTGWVAQWENPAACFVRNRIARLLPASMVRRQLDWIVGYEG